MYRRAIGMSATGIWAIALGAQTPVPQPGNVQQQVAYGAAVRIRLWVRWRRVQHQPRIPGKFFGGNALGNLHDSPLQNLQVGNGSRPDLISGCISLR